MRCLFKPILQNGRGSTQFRASRAVPGGNPWQAGLGPLPSWIVRNAILRPPLRGSTRERPNILLSEAAKNRLTKIRPRAGGVPQGRKGLWRAFSSDLSPWLVGDPHQL